MTRKTGRLRWSKPLYSSTYHYRHCRAASACGFVSNKRRSLDIQTINVADLHAAAVELGPIECKDRRIRDVARDVLAANSKPATRTEIVARHIPQEQRRCDLDQQRCPCRVLEATSLTRSPQRERTHTSAKMAPPPEKFDVFSMKTALSIMTFEAPTTNMAPPCPAAEFRKNLTPLLTCRRTSPCTLTAPPSPCSALLESKSVPSAIVTVVASALPLRSPWLERNSFK